MHNSIFTFDPKVPLNFLLFVFKIKIQLIFILLSFRTILQSCLVFHIFLMIRFELNIIGRTITKLASILSEMHHLRRHTMPFIGVVKFNHSFKMVSARFLYFKGTLSFLIISNLWGILWEHVTILLPNSLLCKNFSINWWLLPESVITSVNKSDFLFLFFLQLLAGILL